MAQGSGLARALAFAVLLPMGVVGALALLQPERAAAWTAALQWRADAWARGEPWRLWTAAWVHRDAAHWAGNLLAGGALWGLARAAKPPRMVLWAWLAAWPMTHALLALPFWHPALLDYAGASGLWHATAALMAVAMIGGWGVSDGAVSRASESAAPARSSQQHSPSTLPLAAGQPRTASHWPPLRSVGFAVLAGLFVKLLLEAPWAASLQSQAAHAFPVAVAAHACGVAAGLTTAGLAHLWRTRRLGRRAPRIGI